MTDRKNTVFDAFSQNCCGGHNFLSISLKLTEYSFDSILFNELFMAFFTIPAFRGTYFESKCGTLFSYGGVAH